MSSLVFVSFNSLGKCELSERFDQQNHAAHKTLSLLFVAEDRGDKDEEARESVDHREYDSLNIASAPGREEPDDKAQAEHRTKLFLMAFISLSDSDSCLK